MNKIKEINYKTLSTINIAFASVLYSLLSILFGGVFYFYTNITIVLIMYVIISLIIVVWLFIQSRRRTLIDKLPSSDIVKLLYLIKNKSGQKNIEFSGSWHVNIYSFNKTAMKELYPEIESELILPHDYFSYLLATKYIFISSFIDNGNIKENNNLSISLSIKGLEILEIYEKSIKW